MTPQERLQIWREIRQKKMIKMIGLMASAAGQAILKRQGYDVDYKINGLTLDDVIQLDALSLKEQLELAIRDERFEHAALLRDRIRQISG